MKKMIDVESYGYTKTLDWIIGNMSNTSLTQYTEIAHQQLTEDTNKDISIKWIPFFVKNNGLNLFEQLSFLNEVIARKQSNFGVWSVKCIDIVERQISNPFH
jgi:hypothetical protein